MYYFSYRRRRESFYRASFRRFASSLQMRRNHVVKSTSKSRTSIEGFFNSEFVGDDTKTKSTQQQKRGNEYQIDSSEESYSVENVVDSRHDYAVILYKRDKLEERQKSSAVCIEEASNVEDDQV
jgi:hypothetical protein